ncbi:MAG: M24 family metallopeptidase [Alphaproteobacteria bacterium]|nr:M24 family metallopeptidase [Alphaproteobacteria bacterium]
MKNGLQEFDALLYMKSSLYPNFNDEENTDFLKMLCGLKASAGTVVIAKNKSAIFVDGRYQLAAKISVDSKKFSIESLSLKDIISWIKNNVPFNSRIAFDPRFFSHSLLKKTKSELNNYDFTEINLDEIFATKNFQRESEIISWKFDESKFNSIYEIILENDLDGYLICDPCSSAWLLNQRDIKTKNVPVSLGYLLVTKNKEKIFYFDDNYFCSCEKNIRDLMSDISSFTKIGLDFSEAPAFINSPNLVDVRNPIPNIKYIKTAEEIETIKRIAIEDSEAIVKFLYWFYHTENISELDCVDQIFLNRKESQNFTGNSFDTIAAADENSAIVHYIPTQNTNKKIEKFLLLDSGGQYKFGTTDITRTLAKKQPSEMEKLYYTLVLKGHIAVASAKLKKGSTAAVLDNVARKFLQQHSLDYNHSTGHGIGYMLNVHEGPVAISRNNKIPLQANILLSNEPGVYIENHMGVRLENMIVTEERNGFIYFDTISLVPFDNRLIDYSLLTFDEKLWLRSYNEKILNSLKLPKNILDWLAKYTNTFAH